MIFSYGLVYGIGIWAGWELHSSVLLLFAAGYAVISYGRSYAKEKKIPIDSFFLVLGGSFLAWLLFTKIGKSYGAETVSYFMDWRLSGRLELKYGWLLPPVLLGIAAAVYRKLSRYLQVKLVISAGISALLIWQAWEEAAWEVLPVAALFFTALDGWIESYVQIVKNQEQKTKYFLPLLVGTVLLTAVLPVKKEPVSWEGVERAVSGVKDTVNELLANVAYGDGDGEFIVSMTGFSETDKSFWGKLVNDGAREMLKVSVPVGRGTQARYFAGVIKEIYESDFWSVQDEGESERTYEAQEKTTLPVDTSEHLYYLYKSGLKGTEGERFCQSYTYLVQYESLRTSVLFTPANTYGISLKRGVSVDDTGTGVLAFDKKQGKGDSYEVSALAMNLENEALVEYLRKATKSGEGTSDVTAQDFTEDGAEDTVFMECMKWINLSEEQTDLLTGDEAQRLWEEREKEVYQRDLQLPKNLSKEIKVLAEELTGDADNDYDKVQAIVKYLTKEGDFTYSLTPPAVPEGQPVMDYFLFESKEGYCTYFATAMVLLCRSAKIPARYVEGVATNYEEEVDDFYPIYGNNTHAWSQVYLRGFGWLDVDATPGYGGKRGDWSERAGGYTPDMPSDMPVMGGEIHTEIQGSQTEAKETGRRLGMAAAFLGVALFGLFAAILIRGGIAYLFYRRAGRRKQAELLMRRLMTDLMRRGLGIAPEETLRMYRARLMETEGADMEYLNAFEWYEGIRYGEKEIGQDEIRRMERVCHREKKRTAAVRRKNFLAHFKWRRRVHSIK